MKLRVLDWRKCMLGVVLSGTLLAQSTQLWAQDPRAASSGAADASEPSDPLLDIEWPTGEDIFARDPTGQVLRRGGVGEAPQESPQGNQGTVSNG